MTSIIEESRKAKQKGVFGFWRNKKFIYSLVALLVISGAYYFYSKKTPTSETVLVKKESTVKNGDIIVSVESTGKVVAKDGVDLSFSVSGDSLEVNEVFVKEGDKIKKGDKIASVKTDTLNFSLQTAWTSYQSTLADFNETMAGASADQIASAKEKITSAQISLDQAKSNLEETKQSTDDSIYNAEQKVQDAKEALDKNTGPNNSEDVRTAYELLVDTIKSTSISLEAMLKDSDEIIGVDNKYINDDFEGNLGAKNSGSLNDAKSSYLSAKEENEKLNSLAISITAKSDYKLIDQAASQASLTLDEFEKHLYDMKVMLDASITSVDFTQSNLDGFISSNNSNRTSVNSKITTLNSKITSVQDAKDGIKDYQTAYNDALRNLDSTKADALRSIQNAEDNITSRQISLDQANRDYDDLLAPLTDAEIASAKSRLTSASISLQKAQFDLDKATLTSPIDGQIVQLSYAAGDIITDNSKSVVTIINNDTLFIEANIEEADIAKLEVGQKTYATFDALEGLRLEGEISFISLTSETSNNGITTYLVRVTFSKGENQIREGMTASIEFVTAEAKDVLMVPVSAVRNVNGKPSVQLKTEEWIPVVTGFTDGKNVELISGLNQGDIVFY